MRLRDLYGMRRVKMRELLKSKTNRKDEKYIHTYRIERETTTELRTKGREFINKYHSYIKWSERPSRKLYWNLYENDIMVGVFALGSAFNKPKAVKNFMEENKLEFNEIANNIVFCLANQINKNAGTKLLSIVRRDAILWWYERYGDLLKCFQTFILPPRTGAIYKADNWKEFGSTTGGKALGTKTIPEKTYEENKEYYDSKNLEIRIFKNNKVRYILREFKETESKLIFMKLNKDKEINKVLKIHK